MGKSRKKKKKQRVTLNERISLIEIVDQINGVTDISRL